MNKEELLESERSISLQVEKEKKFTSFFEEGDYSFLIPLAKDPSWPHTPSPNFIVVRNLTNKILFNFPSLEDPTKTQKTMCNNSFVELVTRVRSQSGDNMNLGVL